MPLKDGVFTPITFPSVKHQKVFTTPNVRYRAIHGGRNGAKDWTATEVCCEIGIRTPKRFLFTREMEKSLRASAHLLISDQIKRNGLSEYYDILHNEIRGKNGTLMMFTKISDLVVSDLKSMESVDICVVMEAENYTKETHRVLTQTIRAPGSEMWFIFNDQFEDDFIYQFCVANPPATMVTEHVNGYAVDNGRVIRADNPYVTDDMLTEAQYLYNTDKDAFNHDCLGMPLGQGGRVYPMYNPDVHLIDFDFKYLSQCDLYMSIDPAHKYYPAIGWHAVTPGGVVITYNEWPKFKDLDMWFDEARETKHFETPLKDLANIILSNDKTLQHGGSILARTIDPRFEADNPDYTAELVKYNVHSWRQAPFEMIETQRENIRSMMAYNPEIPIIGNNKPTYYIDRSCTNHDRAFRRHSWDQKKDKECEKHKDIPDQVRYFRSLFGREVTYTDRIPVGGRRVLSSAVSHSTSGIPANAFRE
jgi:hypothetical protein